MSEVTFKVPLDVPITPRSRMDLRSYFQSMVPQIGQWGKDGQDVGVGFVWESSSGVCGTGLNKVSRTVQRALYSSGLMSRRSYHYFLTQRIKYVRDCAEPFALVTLKED